MLSYTYIYTSDYLTIYLKANEQNSIILLLYFLIQILALGRMKSAMKSVFGGVILSAQTAVDSTVAVSGDDDDALSPRASSSATSSVTPATTVPVSATATGTTTGITSNEHTVRDDIETNAHQLSTLVRRYSSVGVPVLESHASLFSVLSSGSKSTDVPVIRQISKDTDDGDASPHLLVIGEEEISFEVRGEPEQSLARSVSVPLPHSAKREMETQLEMLLSTKQTIIEQISEEQTELEKLNSAEILKEVELVPEQLEQRRQETKRRLSRLEGDLKTNGKKIKILREL